MGFLIHIFLAIGTQILAEAGFETGWRAPWAFVPLALLPYLVARRAREQFLSGKFQRAVLLERCVHFAAPVLHAIFALGCGWVLSVRMWTSSELTLMEWPEPALFLALLPYVVLQLITIDAQSRIQDTRADERAKVRKFQARMFSSALLPILLYILIASLVGWSDPVRVQIERVSLYNAAFLAGVMLVLSVTLPTLLKNTWETVPLEAGVQRDVLSSVAERAAFSCRSLLKWRTGNLMANAAIVGFLPQQRVVIFSDSLLSMLSLRQLAAVFAHEMGHAKRHHVGIFVSWALAFALGGTVLVEWLAGDTEWLAVTIALGVLAVWFLSFGWLSRRFELEADLYSLELLNDPEAMVGALERVGGRLRDVASWRHFSTARRVEFIQRVAENPELARSFRSRLRAWSISSLVLALGAIGAHGYQLARDFGPERVVAELALGRYENAVRFADNHRVDEEVAELARIGQALAAKTSGELSLEQLEHELEATLARAQFAHASRIASLLVVREETNYGTLIDALDALAAADGDAYSVLRESVPEPWRARLEAARQ